jgi:nucleoside-diphosphate-sugar epimerase
MKLTSWRLDIEKKATSNYSKSFTGNVIRPSILYGSSGSLTAMLFASAKAGTVEWYGDKEQRISTIHQADLGEAFRLVTEKAYAIPGIIFDLTNDYPESMAEIMHQLQAVSGAKEIKYKQPENGEAYRTLI